MNINEILQQTSHRPWKLANKNWKFYQEWNNAIFLHWQVEQEVLREFIPQSLEIDLLEGKAWVSLVAFKMQKIRVKNTLSFRPISDFEEINIRTYVKYKDKPGVYFLSIEGSKLASCKLSKAISGLSYRFSKIKRRNSVLQSKNKSFGDKLTIKLSIGDKLFEKSILDIWLTERYALFLDTPKSIDEFEIHHLEWPLYDVKSKEINLNYNRFKTLLKGLPQKTHYSEGVKVLAWPKKRHWLSE